MSGLSVRAVGIVSGLSRFVSLVYVRIAQVYYRYDYTRLPPPPPLATAERAGPRAVRFGKGSLLRNEPQYPTTMGYALHTGHTDTAAAGDTATRG